MRNQAHPIEFDILYLLASNPRVFSTDDIREGGMKRYMRPTIRSWYISDAWEVRWKRHRQNKIITTVWGVGYKIEKWYEQALPYPVVTNILYSAVISCLVKYFWWPTCPWSPDTKSLTYEPPASGRADYHVAVVLVYVVISGAVRGNFMILQNPISAISAIYQMRFRAYRKATWTPPLMWLGMTPSPAWLPTLTRWWISGS